MWNITGLGNRERYKAPQLHPMQVGKLLTLDRALLRQAGVVKVCYGPSLEQLMNNLGMAIK